MKRFTFIFALLLATTTMMAEKFRVGQLTFETTSDNEVKVVKADKSIISALFSPTITFQGVTYNVTSIGGWAFEDCSSLTSITIPNSVTSIGGWAFYECSSLTSITIPNSVTSIGDAAFQNCSGLTSITIPNSVTSIGMWAFAGCSALTSITIPNSVTSINAGAFYDCSSLTSITIPNSVTNIGNKAFSDCSGLTSVTLGNSITSIGYAAFYNTALSNNPTNWVDGALYLNNCLISVNKDWLGDYCVKENTRLIAGGSFAKCRFLTSVTIPNSVTSIGDYAFAGCSSLNYITIPNSVKYIGDATFEYLTIVTIPSEIFMADNYVNSVVTSNMFEQTRVQREAKVINNLVSLRAAEIQFRLDKGYFTTDLDSLIDYLKITPKKEVFKVGSLTLSQLSNGMTEYKAAKILERARLKAQRKMKFQGPDSLDMLYNYIWENDRDVKAVGLQGFRRDTILTNMIQALYKGQYTEETIGEIIYIPYTDNVKFEVETNNGYTTSQGIQVPIFEIRAHYNTYLHDLNNHKRVDLIDKVEELGYYPGLKVGSVEVPNKNATKFEVIDTDSFFEEEIYFKQRLQFLPPPPPPPAVPKEDVLNVVEDEVEEVMAVDPTNDEGDEMVYIVVETMPEFPGGAQAMMRFISENIQYPPAAQENGIQGRVICQFVVEKDGKVTDIHVVRSSGDASLDKEAIRVINSMPNWKPGTQRGKPVRVKYTIPVNFRLQ